MQPVGQTPNEKSARWLLWVLIFILGVFVGLVSFGFLAGLLLSRSPGPSEQARVTATITQIGTFNIALGAYEVDTGRFPREQDGLRALFVQPAGVTGWRGPYVLSVPLDPWGHAYVYQYPGKLNPRGYDIISMGPDGELGTADDIYDVNTKSR